MIEVVLCIFIAVRAISGKEYRFFAVSVISILHSMTVALNNPDNMAYMGVLNATEILLLISLTAVLIYCAWIDKGKHYVVPAVLAGVACIVRFLRSSVYDWYADAATQSGADSFAIINELSVRYNLLNRIIDYCILAILVYVAWRLRKKTRPA